MFARLYSHQSLTPGLEAHIQHSSLSVHDMSFPEPSRIFHGHSQTFWPSWNLWLSRLVATLLQGILITENMCL